MQERGPYFMMTVGELRAELKAGKDLWLMDIRDRAVFRRDHIPGSHNIPRAEFADRKDSIPRDKTILVICDSGLHAGQVAGMLGSMGLRAGVLIGGMKSWKKSFASHRICFILKEKAKKG